MTVRQLVGTVLLAVCAGPAGLYAAGTGTGMGPAAAAARVEPRARVATVTLRDGSLLKGRIASLRSGRIRLETQQLGTLSIPAAAVQSIVYSDTSPASARGRPRANDAIARAEHTTGRKVAPTRIAGADLQGLMQFITGSPDLARSVSALQQDPEIQAVLSDPAIQHAVQSGNLLRLMTNPKILKLLHNSKLRSVSHDVAQKYKR